MPAPARLTVLKAFPAHLSRIPFDSRHLFSSLPLAVMQVRKAERSAGQNLKRMSWRGEPSSSLAKLGERLEGESDDLLDNTFISES